MSTLPPDAKRLLWSLVDLYTPSTPPRPKLTVTAAVARVKTFVLESMKYMDCGETWQEAAGYLFNEAFNFDDGFDFLYDLRLVKGDEWSYHLTALGKRVLANIERAK